MLNLFKVWSFKCADTKNKGVHLECISHCFARRIKCFANGPRTIAAVLGPYLRLICQVQQDSPDLSARVIVAWHARMMVALLLPYAGVLFASSGIENHLHWVRLALDRTSESRDRMKVCCRSWTHWKVFVQSAMTTFCLMLKTGRKRLRLHTQLEHQTYVWGWFAFGQVSVRRQTDLLFM